MIERSVGLIVMADMPGMGLAAVLRERGYWNFEKMKPESYPGGCQVTAHGKLEEGESFETALAREIKEELGEQFSRALFVVEALSQAGGFFKEGILEVHREETSEKVVITFATKVDGYFISHVRLGPETGGLRLLAWSELEKIVDLREFSKETGVPDRVTIAMFPDEKKAVEKAFDLFSTPF